MKIYTKTGDKGETGLFGGERVPKFHLRIETYGTIDELNSLLGLTICEVQDVEIKTLLEKIQNQLFNLGSDLATPREEKNEKYSIPRISQTEVDNVEEAIDLFTSRLEELRNFILPGGTRGASMLHLARTVCRRAERIVVRLNKSVELGNYIIVYLNRLSDLFFVLARYENSRNGIPDVLWKKS
ncbi:MAG: cob(I)yrinic acid a,c-diamide adenosyltransferase [Methanococcaceae archaeon]